VQRYFIHLWNGIGFVEDEEGQELPDREAAIQSALDSVRSIVSEDARQGLIDLNGRVSIADQQGQTVAELVFRGSIFASKEGGMIERLLMKMRQRDDVSMEEERALRAAVSETRDLPADLTFIRRNQELDHSTVLLEGMLCRYKDLRNGERQVTELHVAGDFADLHSFTLKKLDHEIMTLTACKVALVPHENLKRITEGFPHLARVLWFMTNLDAAIHREWAVSLGRRDAVSRLAHLFCELQVRLEIVGLAAPDGYDLPLTQTELSECTGITPVHVNRSLRVLREDGVLDVRNRRVTILDRGKLERAAEFDPSYLYLERRPR
jgi:CRP-like cAMP-binding protein